MRRDRFMIYVVGDHGLAACPLFESDLVGNNREGVPRGNQSRAATRGRHFYSARGLPSIDQIEPASAKAGPVHWRDRLNSGRAGHLAALVGQGTQRRRGFLP